MYCLFYSNIKHLFKYNFTSYTRASMYLILWYICNSLFTIMLLLYRCSRIIILSKLLKYMNKENKHCCLIPIVTLYNVLRHVIITLLLLIIICT